MPSIKKFTQNLIKALFFLGIGVSILFLVYRGQNKAYQDQCAMEGVAPEDCNLIQKVLTDFAGADMWWLSLVVLLFVISNFSRAARWHILLKPLGYKPRYINSLLSIFLGYFANLGLPRLGEFIRATTISRYERFSIEKVVGTIVVDRVVDMLSFLVVLGITLLFEADTLLGYLSENAVIPGKDIFTKPGFWIVVIAIIAAMWILWSQRKRFSDNVIYQKVSKIVGGFVEGIKAVLKLDKPWSFLFHSVVIWGAYYLMTYLCFNAFAPTDHLGPQAGLLIFVFASLGMLIPSPGGMGTYHMMVIAGLTIYGISQGDSFSFANIIFFSIQIFGIVIFGLVSLLLLPFVNRNYHPKSNEALIPETP